MDKEQTLFEETTPDGQTLVMGSTTGALWVSENQGDSWECVSAHLPPVYCVRFDPSEP